jgi:hypothetical protein
VRKDRRAGSSSSGPVRLSRCSLGVAVALSFVTGAALSLANGPLFAIMQATVAKDMQGRVFTLLASVGGAMIPLGLAVAGPVVDAIGVRPLMGIEEQAAKQARG